MFQLPLSWPSELVRKYKQKNQRKILLNNLNSQNRSLSEESNIEIKSYNNNNYNDKTIEIEKFVGEENPFSKGNDIKNFNSLKNADREFALKNMKKIEEEIEIEKTYDLIEDEDDFIIGRKLKKINKITEKEKNCEDLEGWDED
jgi:hypothetical protein